MRSVDRVQQALQQHGLNTQVLEMPQSTRTAQMAAEAIGTHLGSIVKSLVFLADGQPALVLVAGDRRADPHKIASFLGADQAVIANAEQVRAETGFAIGGVPPVGHSREMPVLIDESLGRFETVYAAAGTPNAIFPIAYTDLVRITGGQVTEITQREAR
jgi:Cys-tRNA(Pro) deacylase